MVGQSSITTERENNDGDGVDACGSVATETVASISSHVTRVSMYFAVGIGCLPLKVFHA